MILCKTFTQPKAYSLGPPLCTSNVARRLGKLNLSAALAALCNVVVGAWREGGGWLSFRPERTDLALRLLDRPNTHGDVPISALALPLTDVIVCIHPIHIGTLDGRCLLKNTLWCYE